MKKFFNIFLLITCFFTIDVFSSNIQKKHYVDSSCIVMEDNQIFINLNDDWFQTKALRNDNNGLYVSEEDVVSCGSIVSKPQRWKCPYCHRWWNIGEKCKNPDCPTNQW